MRIGSGLDGASAGVRAEGPCGVNIAAEGVWGWSEIANSKADLIVGLCPFHAATHGFGSHTAQKKRSCFFIRCPSCLYPGCLWPVGHRVT